MAVTRRAKNTITYHGRAGKPTVHRTEKGREYMLVRAKGGGVKRLYEGSEYRIQSRGGPSKRLVLK